MNQRGLDSVYSLSALEAKLVAYVRDADAASQPFDVSSVPKVSRQQAAQEVARKCGTSLSVQPLIVAQGQARWIPLVPLSQERRLQCRHPKQRSRHNRHTYNSWPKCQNWHRTVPSSTVRSPSRLPRTRLNTKFHVLSTFSANTLSSRFVCPTLFHDALILNQLSLMCQIQCRILFWIKSPLLCSLQLTVG